MIQAPSTDDKILYAHILKAPPFENGNMLAKVFTYKRSPILEDHGNRMFLIDVEARKGDLAETHGQDQRPPIYPKPRYRVVWELMKRIHEIDDHVPDCTDEHGIKMELWQVKPQFRPSIKDIESK